MSYYQHAVFNLDRQEAANLTSLFKRVKHSAHHNSKQSLR
jgi:hypothetical protein